MRFFGLAMLALLALAVPSAGSAQDIVVQGGVYRTEIERILRADNVDTSRLGAGEVADAIADIRRGRAPDDFWTAYQAHVQAWRRLAAAEESGLEATLAEQAIEATFDEVERIAQRYGARLPTPPWAVLPTV